MKLNKQVNNRQAGEIIRVDDGSAASLVEKEVGEIVESRDEAEVLRSAARRGNVIVQQVADADDPNAVAGEPAEGETGDAAEVVDGQGDVHTGELPPPDTEPKKDEKTADTPASKRGKSAENVGQPETPPESNPPA
ncbi:hypothetical protein H7J86_26320 [Mycobacterium hackensackense]|uniref:hypothetical protein n=1 Tax=Mycobacterium hackensackense TaxID=228909 RepID=UPI002265CE67|nr:hypothetical protein [Mycobacterium hackensackense]MCV7255685.1 hypothetical protein [Mycobacterium hackensackense]